MANIKIEIKNRFTGSLLFEWESENNTIKETVFEALKTRANLSDANLFGANLSGANLSGADLFGADLSRANLYRADLSGASLYRADLSGANLSDANLFGANLSDADLFGADLSRANLFGANLYDANLFGANLSDADLSRANLSGANLSGANLSGANLSDADLSKIKYDFFGRLLTQKNEAEALKQAIIGGKIDGSAYEGECCCFVGTIANAVKCNYTSLPILKPDASSPTERWFLGIKKGDTHDNSQISKITLEWIEEFQMLIK